MNCNYFEKLIALDVEGDLPSHQAVGVSQHLRTCPHCREFAEKLQASQTLLKELAHEAPDEAALQQVRLGVLSRVPTEATPAGFPVWRFALGAALVTMLAFAGIRLKRPAPAPPLQVNALMPPPEAMRVIRQAATPAPTSPGRNPEKARVATARKPFSGALRASAKQRPEPLMVKLFTDNPNVVIYWQVD
jgi:anti-sigma factor RsiW